MLVSGVNLPIGTSFNSKKARQAIDFIKPYRARPLVVAASYIIKDPFDTLIIKDKVMTKGFMRISCDCQYDFGCRYDKWLFDEGNLLSNPIRHDTVYGFDGLPYSIMFDDIDRITNALLLFDSSFYFDNIKKYDLKYRNTNICNVFEFSDIIKTIGYSSIRSSNYTPQQYLVNNPYEFNVLDKIVKSLTEKKIAAQNTHEAAQEAYEESPDETKAITKRALDITEQKLNLISNQLAYYSSLPKEEIVPASSASDLDREDKFNFHDTVFQVTELDSIYDNGCIFDVDGFNTFDEEIYYLREAL